MPKLDTCRGVGDKLERNGGGSQWTVRKVLLPSQWLTEGTWQGDAVVLRCCRQEVTVRCAGMCLGEQRKDVVILKTAEVRQRLSGGLPFSNPM